MIQVKVDPEEIARALAAEIGPQLQEIHSRLDELERRISEQGSPREYLRPSEAARRYDVSTKMLGIWAERGYFRRYDAGTHARYRADEIERYLARKNQNGLKRV